MKELDEILLDQYHAAKRRRKIYKRMRNLMPYENLIHIGEQMTDNNIVFFASMINDKSLLKNNHNKKRQKEKDILLRNPVYEWYKTIIYMSLVGYKTFMGSATQYMSYFKKDKNDKTQS